MTTRIYAVQGFNPTDINAGHRNIAMYFHEAQAQAHMELAEREIKRVSEVRKNKPRSIHHGVELKILLKNPYDNQPNYTPDEQAYQIVQFEVSDDLPVNHAKYQEIEMSEEENNE